MQWWDEEVADTVLSRRSLLAAFRQYSTLANFITFKNQVTKTRLLMKKKRNNCLWKSLVWCGTLIKSSLDNSVPLEFVKLLLSTALLICWGDIPLSLLIPVVLCFTKGICILNYSLRFSKNYAPALDGIRCTWSHLLPWRYFSLNFLMKSLTTETLSRRWKILLLELYVD